MNGKAPPTAVVSALPREVWPLLGSIAATELAMVVVVLWAASALDTAGAIAAMAGAVALAAVVTLGARHPVGLGSTPRRSAQRRAAAVPAPTFGNGS